MITRRTYPVPGGEIAAVHFGRVSNPLKVVFLHANGFNAMTYASVLAPLGVHAMAVDLRGHGRTTLPARPRGHTDWGVYRDDVVALFEHIPRPVLVAGHSLGAVVGILAARRLGPRMAGYVGFDPVTMPRAMWWLYRVPGYAAWARRSWKIARRAGARRAEFDSREDAHAHYRGRGTFGRMPDAVLRDFLVDGLRQDDLRGGVRLACEPEWEQANFAAQGHDIYRGAHALPRFSRIAYAGGRGVPHTPGARLAMTRILGPDRVSFDPELGHLFPLERPELATATLRDALRELALARPAQAGAQARGRSAGQ